MTENREYCKRVAQEVELYASGDGYRCPKCGEVITFDNDQYNEDEARYTCQECGEEFDESDLEAVSLYDYFADVLDYDFRVNSQKELTGVRVWVTLGGPNVWIDTEDREVKLAWGSDREAYALDWDVCGEIEEYFQEVFDNM